jgi:PTH1 family peptidyl-tRNA hydrolase
MDLPVAGIKIRQQGGSGGHKGVQSVIDHLETESFLRIRIGIGHPEPDRDPTDFVLEPCPPTALKMLLSMIQKTDQMIDVIIKDGPRAAMNLFNH